MAGLVAMTAGLEDFEATQPCKKMRKDDDPPPAKTITNYFLPLPKPVDKPFSPPRSNNILDYFRKPPTTQEKTTSSKDLQSSACEEVSPKVSRAAPRQKRIRKVKDKPNALQEEDEEKKKEQDVPTEILERPDESLKEEGSRLLPQNDGICRNKERQNAEDDVQNSKRKHLSPQTDDHLITENSSSQEDKCRSKRSAMRRKRNISISQKEICKSEQDQSLHDASMEINVDESSVLNCSTVTVSFEEFLQSQVENKDDLAADSDTCDAKSSEFKLYTDVSEPLAAELPRTLTVQAEVHPISTDHELVRSAQVKVASIFTRNKKLQDGKKSSNTPQANTDILPDRKRKSNVVLLEDDLEIAVVESSSTPKCTQEERKQFMKAFKQPGPDGSKGKAGKMLSKSKPDEENESETQQPERNTEKTNPEATMPEQDTEQQKAEDGGKVKRKKSVKKGQIEQSGEKTIVQEQNEHPTSLEAEKKTEIDEFAEKPVKDLRRSNRGRRQAVIEPEGNLSSRKTKGSNKAETSSACNHDDVTKASTPKTCRYKKSVYRAEMLSPVSIQGSPIRMRFTRVSPSVTKSEKLRPVPVLESNSLKKRKQAKKLVQKAKAMHKSKPNPAEEKSAVRRSSRSKESIQINYCEDEDSVVFLDDVLSNPATQSGTNRKKLRSLNEVLGKNTPQTKSMKNALASKSVLDRKCQRPSTIISLLDDSSREGSENSQDDEHFQAKREFLKSGLPETLKKQIAKMAASREAYAQACTSFQSVVHVQQKLRDCCIWTLPWPENPFLSCLKEDYNMPSAPVVLLKGHAGNFTVPTRRNCRIEVSGRRENFPELVRDRLVEEISISNPSFPVKRFFTRFLKRHTDFLQLAVAEAESGCEAAPVILTKSTGGKRKRVDEGDRVSKVAKKQKSTHREKTVVILDSPDSASGETPEATDSVTHNSDQRRRSQRNKQSESKPRDEKKQRDSIIIVDSPPPESCAKDFVTEDVPWTEKYQPQQSSDVIGNTASVRKLHCWLKEWKFRADREEKRKQQEKTHDDDSNDSWLGGDSNEGLEDLEDTLCNTLLITGPTGVGKTAAVYACAQELGFKVFEVNCSSQRSGRQILSQLKEATQSHQVDIHGVNTYKPTYFNSYSSGSLSSKPASSPRKVNSPRRVVSSPRKPPQSPRGVTSKKGSLAPKSLASFFKMSARPTGKGNTNEYKKSQTSCPRTPGKVTPAEGKSPESKASSEEQRKKTATSLILFEEVDVIFDDDSGFLSAVKTFMTTTKRPIILTTSDPLFGAMFDGYFDEIHFKAPSLVDVTSYLQLLCIVENMRTDTQDLSFMLNWNRCDIRQSLLQLQFWTCSGGGQQVPRPILQTGASECNIKNEAVSVESAAIPDEIPPVNVPPCHFGCTESFLGLQQDLLKSEYSTVELSRLDLLAAAERKGVNLLYSNLEVLLPLPVRPLPDHVNRLRLPSNTEAQTGLLARVFEQEEHSDDTSPVKVSCRMRRKKQLHTDEKNAFQSDSDSEDDFLSLPKPATKPAQDEAAQEPPASKAVRTRLKLSESEKKKSQSVSQCLGSLAEYLDHMSFLDSSLHYELHRADGPCRPQDFNGVGAEIKCGMTDDVRLECGDHLSECDSEEISAVLGTLSFYKCKARLTDAWNKVQELEEPIRTETVEELTLPVASHRQSFSLSHNKLLDPRVLETRREVINTVLTSQAFSTQGNKAAATVDFLPSLRTICRSERLKERGKVKRRFLHYFDNIHLDLPKSTVQQLASNFP